MVDGPNEDWRELIGFDILMKIKIMLQVVEAQSMIPAVHLY